MMESVWPYLQSLQGLPAYALLFALLFGCGIGLPMNEDIVLLAAAALTLKGVMEPVPLMVVAWFGLVGGDALVFHWGHRYGTRLLRKRLVGPHHDRRRDWIPCRPPCAATGRPISLSCASCRACARRCSWRRARSRCPIGTCSSTTVLAALIELPLLVYGVRYVGGRWEEILAL